MIDKRLMYAQGQRVAKTLNGSRPGYAGPNEPNDGQGVSAGAPGPGDTGGEGGTNPSDKSDTQPGPDPETNRESYRTDQYKNMPTPTVTVGVDKFDNPINIKTTYTEKRNRQNVLDALNAKGISSFDPRVTKLGISPFGFFAPPEKKTGGFWGGLKTIAKNIGLGIVAPQLLAGTKVGQVLDVYNTINRVNNLVNSLGITDINVIDSLKSNLTSPKSKKSTKTGPKDPPREGGEGGNEQNALLSEYILLLQRMEQGMLSAEEQGRFNSLKSRLGKADGGIMNVNMNRGQLGETLHG